MSSIDFEKMGELLKIERLDKKGEMGQICFDKIYLSHTVQHEIYYVYIIAEAL
ncbi:MAG: hypothetical protein ACE5GV_07570 [Candidatus Scalindua sp.]